MSDFYRREDINMGVYRRKAQYHETDQMGIIHHSNYVKWMEEARIDFMKELGFGYGEVEKRGIVSPGAEVSVSYKKPVLFDEELAERRKAEETRGTKAFTPPHRQRVVSKALRAYGKMVSSADKGGVRVVED